MSGIYSTSVSCSTGSSSFKGVSAWYSLASFLSSSLTFSIVTESILTTGFKSAFFALCNAASKALSSSDVSISTWVIVVSAPVLGLFSLSNLVYVFVTVPKLISSTFLINCSAWSKSLVVVVDELDTVNVSFNSLYFLNSTWIDSLIGILV